MKRGACSQTLLGSHAGVVALKRRAGMEPPLSRRGGDAGRERECERGAEEREHGAGDKADELDERGHGGARELVILRQWSPH